MFISPAPLDRRALTELRTRGIRCSPGRVATLQVLLSCAPGHLTFDERPGQIASPWRYQGNQCRPLTSRDAAVMA